MENRILIVDDEKGIVSPIAAAFKREGYLVETAYDGEEAMKKIEIFKPQIIIMDVMMPKLNGFEVCKRISNRKEVGIILLTAKNDIVDRVLGLELGADDYISKPFDIRELIARVKAIHRRIFDKAPNDEDTVTIEDFSVVFSKRKASIGNEVLPLTGKEFDILTLLLKNLERVYTREELLDIIWGMEYIGGTRAVDIHIQRLRKKLGSKYQNIIQSIYGIGYRAVGKKNE